jgi:hypothetical protein
MQNKLAVIVLLLMSVTASPVFAGRDNDHGSQGSMDHGPSKGFKDQGTSQGPKDDQNAKDSEILLKSCNLYIDRIYQRIQRLQMEIKDKHVSTSVRDELKKLDQSLKEANDIARSLQLM